jgi:hypothetical protein
LEKKQAEHHACALHDLPNVTFYKDERRGRVGILTTLPVKHAMCTLTNAMLRENRICCLHGENFVSRNCKEMEIKALLRDEMETYSYQFKSASTIFNKEQVIYIYIFKHHTYTHI